MSLSTSMNTVLSGMKAAETRLAASAANVANVSSTGTVPDASGATTAYTPVGVHQSASASGTVITSLYDVSPAQSLQYEPSSPDANADGMVAAPNVDLSTEMVNQMTAKIAFEAAAKTMKVLNGMQSSVIDMVS
jgi:flagellar basal-body rod protein FlgC